MEVVLLLSCSLALLQSNVQGAAVKAPLEIISMDDLSLSDREFLADLNNEALRQKRSEDIFSSLKEKLTHGFKTKLHSLAAGSSHGGSSKGHDHYHDEHHDDQTFNLWDLQKSIFHTLLQAAKAIKGGLVFIKGHLIKGSGYIISAKGQLISAKGEAITKMGKHIATSAHLSPKPTHHAEHSGPGHEYGPPPSSSGYGAPSGPSGEYHPFHYGPSSTDAHDHKFPGNFEAYKDHFPRGAHHGILILKKIPKGHKETHKGNDGVHISPEKHKPDSEPEEPTPPYTFLPDLKSVITVSVHKLNDEPSSAPPPSAYPHTDYSTHQNPHHYFLPTPSTPHPPPPTGYEYHPTYHQPTPNHYEPHPTYYSAPSHSNSPHSSYSTPLDAVGSLSTYFKHYKKPSYSVFPKPPQPTPLSTKPFLPIPKHESYEPVQFPKASTSEISPEFSDLPLQKIPIVIRGLENFPHHSPGIPDSHKSTRHSLHKYRMEPYSYAVQEDTEADASTLDQTFVPPPHSSQTSVDEHDLFASLFVHPDILKQYVRALNKNSSHTRSDSGRKQPQNNDLIRSITLLLGQPGLEEIQTD